MNLRYGNLKELCKPAILKKGELYYSGDYIFDIEMQEKEQEFLKNIRCYVASEYFDQYLVNIDIDLKNNLLSSKCTCANYAKDGKPCSHIAAGYLYYLNKIAKEEIGEGSLIEQITKLYNNLTFANKNAKERVNLEVIIDVKREGVMLELRVGTDKLYSVRDLERFLLGIKKEDYVLEFGKGFVLDLQEHYFQEEDCKLLNYLQDILLMAEIASGKRADNNLFEGKHLKLVDSSMKNILLYLKGKKFSIVTDQDKYEECEVSEEQFKFDVVLREDSGELIVSTKTDLPFPITTDYEYVFYNRKVFRCLDSQVNKYKALYPFFIRDENNEIKVVKKEKEVFLRRIFPILSSISTVDLPPELKDKMVSEELNIKFYFDKSGKSVVLKVKFNYNTVEIDASSEKQNSSDIIVVRDVEKEEEIKRILYSMGFEESKDLFKISDESKILELQNHGLEKLSELGEVYYSEDFKKFKIIKNLTFSAGASINSENLLEFSFNVEELNNEELLGTIKALRSGKKYYKASNKGFILLDNPVIQRLNNLLEEMEIKEKNLLSENITLEKYNAFYLKDRLNKYFDSDVVSIDNSYTNLLDSFHYINSEEIEVPAGVQCSMRQYQIAGYRWLKTLREYGFGGILADEMGLGKTLQTISLLMSEAEEENIGPSIVVCPTSLLYNWKEEIEKFAPSLNVLLYYGSKAQRDKLLGRFDSVDVILTTYPIVRIDIEELKKCIFNLAIIDEAQNIKNSTSQNSKSVKELRAKNRYALTGTPIENSLMELWSIFDFVMPGFLFSSSSFKKKYEDPIVRKEDKKALSDLLDKVSPFILRRKKKDVLKELPDKIERKVTLELNKEQRRLYSTYVKLFKKDIESTIEKNGLDKSKIQILAALTRLRQICCDPSTFINDYKGGSGKLDTLYELIEGCIQEGHRILLFSQFTSVLKNISNGLKDMNISFMYLDGSVKSEERLQLVNQFNKGDSSIFLISLKAGGAGLNLTAADVVIHFDPWWNPAVEDQATDRAHRIGQENTVEVIKLIAKGTIEEKIYNLQEKKKHMINDVMEEEAIASSVISSMGIDDIKELFSDAEYDF